MDSSVFKNRIRTEFQFSAHPKYAAVNKSEILTTCKQHIQLKMLLSSW